MSTEARILASLGITDPNLQDSIISGQTRLLILDASAHMDWDWLLPFPVLVTGGWQLRAQAYFHPGVGPVEQILDSAGSLLANPEYRYSVCETGFLRGYADVDPAGFATLLRNGVANGSLRFAGGGITSPDNQVSHGEAFIRNYLLGHLWLARHCPGLPAPVTAWIPDDFGHDPELPVVLQAMGMVAAGFERIPGYTGNPDDYRPLVDGSPGLARHLADDRIDFTWTAADGSSVAAHWLIGGYGQGNDATGNASLEQYLTLNLPVSPTPYIYVPVLSDFSLPNQKLASIVSGWNGPNLQGRPYLGQTVVAATGSFEEYGQLLGFHAPSLRAAYGAEFNANPYWTGYYATRPALKLRHQRATRALLAAEPFGLIARWAQANTGSLAAGTGEREGDLLRRAWELLTPSTHHDYITGTAIPDVYHTEQLRLLDQAVAAAEGLLQDAIDTIAGAIYPNPDQFGATPIAVFNPLAWGRTEVVELSAADVAQANATLSGDGFQSTPDGGLLCVASAPSLGYQTNYLTGSAPAPANPATCSLPVGRVQMGVVTIANGLLTARIESDDYGNWGLVSLVDVGLGQDLIERGRVANDLLFYADGGDEYSFGMESSSPEWVPTSVADSLSNFTAEVLEAGPLRVTVRTTATYDDGTTTIEYVRDYVLHANEPMLRMRTSGAAPMLQAGANQGSSVLVAFPLAWPIASVQHGTPCHWTAVQPGIYWNDQTFLSTHQFVIAQDSGSNALAAIYHAGVHAWGLSYQWNGGSFDPNNGVLYGCLWRNGDGHYYASWVADTPPGGWQLGTDPEVHVLEYALRIPSSLGAPATGAPLRESLAFSSPLLARPLAPWTGELSDSASLASTSSPEAIVTVAKPGSVSPGDVVFRVYQPSNASLEVSLTLDDRVLAGGQATARGQTALERDLDPAAAGRLNVQLNGSTVTFTAPTALTTIAVSPQPPFAAGERPGCLGQVFQGVLEKIFG
jgi:alpha-mannosidase